ncbi:MAG: hypothetical protein E7049_05155 [Lentisphaerae bacterium]|nr:hypothetical protein [Lentisphaerota bacterium]
MAVRMRQRLCIYGGALALYAALIAIAWILGTKSAVDKTESQLDYAVKDFHHTLAGAVDTMLGHVARTAVRHIGYAHPMSMEQMADGAKELDIDELCIVDRAGRVIASNDPRSIDVVMAGDPVLEEFMQLTNGVVATVSQPFRAHIRNPKFRAKYLGAPFPGGDGFIQVGLEERRLTRMLPSILGYIFDEWLLGRTGFFLCADCETGRLISNPSCHRNAAKTIEETGYDISESRKFEFVADGRARGTTFSARLFDEECLCRAFVFAGHRFVAALPMREYFDTRSLFVYVFGTVLFLVLAAFALFIDRIFRDADRLKAFYEDEKKHLAKDMMIASSIQESAVPCVFPPFSEEHRMDIYASMHLARDVGGDFYDFYFTGPNRFSFLVADVSGKGVPAALFMMRAKATIKGIAQTGLPPDEVATRANESLSKGNEANMFVTAWIGELDLCTGVVTYVNAGHNPPLVIREGEENSTPQFVRDRSGLMFGAMTGIKYRSYQIKLNPGDHLYLYTDGITEQPDAKGRLFGEERLAFSVSTMIKAGAKVIDNGKSPLLGAVFDAVVAHGSGVEQADDCTQLVIRYNAGRRIMTFAPTQQGVAAASDWLDGVLPQLGADILGPAIHVILDEISSNIVRHSGATKFDICLESVDDAKRLRMTFSDDGKPYDPLAHTDPDTTLSASERPIGGLGILMVKKMSDAIAYRYAGLRNILTIEKRIPML